jgi:hypothetical protein
VIYPAKRDLWMACLVVPTGLAVVGIGAVICYQTVIQAIPPVLGLLGTMLPLGIGGLLLWVFVGTSYEIGENELVNRVGPFRFRVPLNAIEEVASTTGFRPVVGLGLAWSLDMLHVKYRKVSGRPAWPVSISPQDKAGFLQELAAAVPGLKIVQDGPGKLGSNGWRE